MLTDADKQIVVEATKVATQEVAARNRRRLRVESLLIGGIVACLIAIPVTKHTDSVAHQRSKENCALIKELAGLGVSRIPKEIAAGEKELAEAKNQEAELHRFEHESADRFGLTQKRFDELQRKAREKNAAKRKEAAERRQDEIHRAEILTRVAAHSCS